MLGFIIKLNKRELILVYTLLTIFILEFITLAVMIYYAKFVTFISFFIRAVKVLSPIFLGLNIIFLISTAYVKGRKLIIKSWKTYLKELLRLSALSLGITLALISVSAFLGGLLGLLFTRIFQQPTVEGVINSLREWIARNFY